MPRTSPFAVATSVGCEENSEGIDGEAGAVVALVATIFVEKEDCDFVPEVWIHTTAFW